MCSNLLPSTFRPNSHEQPQNGGYRVAEIDPLIRAVSKGLRVYTRDPLPTADWQEAYRSRVATAVETDSSLLVRPS